MRARLQPGVNDDEQEEAPRASNFALTDAIDRRRVAQDSQRQRQMSFKALRQTFVEPDD